jgi:putative copper export protein
MLSSGWDTVRLFLHVLAATIWVGGQLTLAALVPALRAAGTDVPRLAARAYNRVAWPAFGVLIVTGVWNIIAVGSDTSTAWQIVLGIKLVVVAISGLTAYLHARAKTRTTLAVYGAATGASAVVALLLGVLLAG